MIARRSFLVTGAAFAITPLVVRASVPPRYTLLGSKEQGSLVIGKADGLSSVKLDDKLLSVSPRGEFAFGLEYKQTDPARLVLKFADGETQSADIAPVVRTYDIQRIDGLPEKYVSPPEEIVKRIQRENAMVAAVRKVDSDGIGFAEPFLWPAKGILSGVFGSQRILNGDPKSPHFAVDIAAPEGTPIIAPADGVVVLAEPDFYLTGGTTVLDHGHGVFTSYSHQNELQVKVGDKVTRGAGIGLVGKKGRATGPHLHWGMNWFQVRLDPSRSTAAPAPERL